MVINSTNPPAILTFSALDPSGCGGLQADIETAASLGAHCAPIATTLCTEGATSQTDTQAVNATVVIEQARSVLEKMDVRAIKIGFVGSVAIMEAIHSILRDYSDIPVVAHPALFLWDQQHSNQRDLPQAFSALIMPMISIMVCSLYEAREVSDESDTLETTAHALLAERCGYALITGTGKDRPTFRNSLFDAKGLVRHYEWEHEPLTTHGSSSTLAMSAAAYMAHGFDCKQAVEHGQNFTMQSVRASRDLGFGCSPHRFFWADKNLDQPSSYPAEKKVH